ncbi:MAG: hypothetical protein HZA89_18155, partial [Verrucomicrobia bacterium]|nr:hypothetical protein [Verrucomicrobiota bacterium]
ATITVVVTDYGGTVKGGLNSVTNTFKVVVSSVNSAPSFTINGLIPGEQVGTTWIARETSRYWYAVASSADGTKLVALDYYGSGGGGRIYTSTNSGVTWTPRESNRYWVSVASSADGTKLVAVEDGYGTGGFIYTSTDSGATWAVRASKRWWKSVASSADGTKLVAVENGGGAGGLIYTSTDSGTTWTARASIAEWFCVAISVDGTKLMAIENSHGSGGLIYFSTNSGTTWVGRGDYRYWLSVATSADGSKLVAGTTGGEVYTSIDSGATWVARGNYGYFGARVASSADGRTLVSGGDFNDQLYVSPDFGVTWTAGGDNLDWHAVASSADGNKLVAVATGVAIYTSVGIPASLTIREDSGTQTLSLNNIASGSADEGNQNVTITAMSSAKSVILNPSVSYTSGSTTGSLSFAPVTNKGGTVTITVIVQDDGGTANGGVDSVTNSFLVIVTSVNDPPTLNPIANRTVLEDSSLQTVTLTGLTVGPADENGQTLTVSAFASHTNLLAQVSANYTGVSTTGTVSFRPVTNQIGTATITVIVRDSGGTTNGGVDSITNTFEVVVAPVNDPPTLATLPSLGISQDVGVQAISLTGISPGPTNESQLTFVSASCNRLDLIFNLLVGYTIGQSTGVLTFTPVRDAVGTATITVVVSDNGGTANGGVDARTNTFTVTVVAPPKVLTPATNLTLLAGANASLSAATAGSKPLFHQWLFNAQPLAGADQPTLNLNNLGRSNTGLYSIRVTNVAGSVTSNNTWLRVLSPQRLERAELLDDGRLRLQFRDELGGGVPAPADVVILTAEELNGTNTVWRTNSGGMIFTNGFLLFEDTNAPAAPRRFYKVLEK